MDKRTKDMYSIQDIIEDLLNKKKIKEIARVRKVSKNTVKKYRKILEGILEKKPEYHGSLDNILDEIRKQRQEEKYSENFGWLKKNNELVEKLSQGCDNYVRLVEVLNEKGFKGSYSSLLRYIEKNRVNSENPIVRIETRPGEIAQVDFGHIGKIYDEDSGTPVKAYVFVMVLGYSRDAYREIVKSQDIETWCNCHTHAFEYFGGVPEIIIPDNLKSAIIKASFLDPVANRTYADLAGHYGFQIDPCLPGTPEHKGKVESGVKYVKNNFMPLREFRSFADANEQLSRWNREKARIRIHGTTRRQPKELFEKYEQEALKPLPRGRFEISIWKELKVYRDIHIQFDYAYYSVPCELRGERVLARKTSSQIAIFHENKLVAVHFPASPGKRSTKWEHYPPDKRKFMKWDTDYCIEKARRTGENTYRVIKRLLHEEPVRYLRSAQNILRKEEKYGREKLEKACRHAVFFGSYSYHTIKNILEKELDIKAYPDTETKKTDLDTSYARDIKQLLLYEEEHHGNHGTT